MTKLAAEWRPSPVPDSLWYNRGENYPGVFIFCADAIVDYFQDEKIISGAGLYRDAGRFGSPCAAARSSRASIEFLIRLISIW